MLETGFRRRYQNPIRRPHVLLLWPSLPQIIHSPKIPRVLDQYFTSYPSPRSPKPLPPSAPYISRSKQTLCLSSAARPHMQITTPLLPRQPRTSVTACSAARHRRRTTPPLQPQIRTTAAFSIATTRTLRSLPLVSVYRALKLQREMPTGPFLRPDLP